MRGLFFLAVVAGCGQPAAQDPCSQRAVLDLGFFRRDPTRVPYCDATYPEAVAQCTRRGGAIGDCGAYSHMEYGAWFEHMDCYYDRAGGQLLAAVYFNDENGGCSGGVLPDAGGTCEHDICGYDGGLPDALDAAASAR